MAPNLHVTRTDYFTYITDGNTDLAFRAKDQVWNCVYQGLQYAIHVAGPNVQPGFVGQYNAFAKKHLLTVGGGSRGGDGYGSHLGSMRSGNTRETRKSAKPFGETVIGKLSSIHNNRQHGNLHDLRAARQDKYDAMDATSQAGYQVSALGGRSQDDTVPLTMVLCDLLPPEDLRRAFAAAIAAERKRVPASAGSGSTLRGPANHGVPVVFDTNCVYQHDDISNTFAQGDTIRVTIYLSHCDSSNVHAHVVHCHGT